MSAVTRTAQGSLRWVDDRLGAAKTLRTAMRKVFPDHWSFLIGEIALFSLVILIATGVYLTLFYVPSVEELTYQGPYEPLQGQKVTAAFDSVMRISFEARGGLLIRQLHHWAALVFVASIILHMLRVFFTGAYRKPRELNYLIGFVLLVLALGLGFTGYSLPDDLLSGIGLRIAYSVSLAIPVVGTWLTFLIFGGEWVPKDIIPRLFVAHVMILPALLIGGLVVHMGLLVAQKHTQFPGKGRTERNVVGKRLWPQQTFKSLGLFLVMTAVLVGMAGFIQINPVWEYGPYDPFAVTAPAQPDWYIGWLDGSLRLAPPWDLSLFGFTISELLLPAVLFPAIAFGVVALWPWIEPRLIRSKDRAEHHLLERPRDNPVRTATGVAGLSVFVVLFLEGGNDVTALLLDIPVEWITRTLQVAFFVVPVVSWFVTYRICKGLQAAELQPEAAAPAGMRLRRNAQGGYETVPATEAPLTAHVESAAPTEEKPSPTKSPS